MAFSSMAIGFLRSPTVIDVDVRVGINRDWFLTILDEAFGAL